MHCPWCRITWDVPLLCRKLWSILSHEKWSILFIYCLLLMLSLSECAFSSFTLNWLMVIWKSFFRLLNIWHNLLLDLFLFHDVLHDLLFFHFEFPFISQNFLLCFVILSLGVCQSPQTSGRWGSLIDQHVCILLNDVEATQDTSYVMERFRRHKIILIN